MENLKELGLSINENLIQEANELEEEIIKKEILPVLSKTIEPALQPVKDVYKRQSLSRWQNHGKGDLAFEKKPILHLDFVLHRLEHFTH